MRPDLSPPPCTEHATEAMKGYQADAVTTVRDAIAAHEVVVVGMKWNPNCSRALRALDRAGVAYHYEEIGSYISQWRPRLGIKLWSGWPTFPQVFVNGVLIGGANQTEAMLSHGQLREMLPA